MTRKFTISNSIQHQSLWYHCQRSSVWYGTRRHFFRHFLKNIEKKSYLCDVVNNNLAILMKKEIIIKTYRLFWLISLIFPFHFASRLRVIICFNFFCFTNFFFYLFARRNFTFIFFYLMSLLIFSYTKINNVHFISWLYCDI
jgi:hypothetical protein